LGAARRRRGIGVGKAKKWETRRAVKSGREPAGEDTHANKQFKRARWEKRGKGRKIDIQNTVDGEGKI